MSKVSSKDGTQIAYEKKGHGPAVILVDGALCYRGFGPMAGLAELIAPYFTVYTYDRRGRGDSSNGKPFALDREIEDIAALIQEAGGTAYLFGISSGACLALEAALKLGKQVARLAMYEPPYDFDVAARGQWKEYRAQLDKLLAADRRGDAVALFMQLVGASTEQVEGARHAPVWPLFEAVAPTLAYDAAAMGEDRSAPLQRAAAISVPALVMDGGANLSVMPFMHDTATKLAQAIPHAELRTLEGQTHEVQVEVLAPILVDFFKS